MIVCAGEMVLTKEYRIPLPLTVDEYRIAQLYMIAVSISHKGQAIPYTLLNSTRSIV